MNLPKPPPLTIPKEPVTPPAGQGLPAPPPLGVADIPERGIRAGAAHLRRQGVAFEDARRAGAAAAYLAGRMGVSPEYAATHFSAISKALYNKEYTPSGLFNILADDYRSAAQSFKYSREAGNMMINGNLTPGNVAAIMKDRHRVPRSNIGKLKGADKLAAQTGSLLGSIVPNALRSGAGGVLGFGLGSATGVPGAGMVGGKIGASLVGAKVGYVSAFGEMFLGFMDHETADGQTVFEHISGLDEAAQAEAYAAVTPIIQGLAIPHAGLEFLQVKGLIKGGGDLVEAVAKRTAKEGVGPVTNALMRRLGRLIVENAGNVTEQMAQEVAQTAIEEASADIMAKRIDDYGAIVEREGIKGWGDAIKETLEMTGAMVLLQLPGATVRAGRAARTAVREDRADNAEIGTAATVPLDTLIPPDRPATPSERQSGESMVRVWIDSDGGKHVVNGSAAYDAAVARGDTEVRTRVVMRAEDSVDVDTDIEFQDDITQMTRDEFAEMRDRMKREGREEGSRLNRVLFQTKLSEAISLTAEQMNTAMSIVDAVAKYRGVSTDEYLSTAFREDAFVHQRAIPGARAAVQFTDGQAQIVFSDVSDFSSFMHEFAHVARGSLRSEDLQAIEAHYDASFDGGNIEAEERWARDMETYFRTGETPAPGLKNVFRRLARLMRDIYGSIIPTLDAPVKEVLDRVFGDVERDALSFSPTTPDVMVGQPQNHHATIKQAVEDGIFVPDRVLRDYEGETWAARELAARDALRRGYGRVLEMAQGIESPDALRAKYEDMFGEGSPLDSAFYEKAWNMANAKSRPDMNRAFIRSMASDDSINQALQTLAGGEPVRGIPSTAQRMIKRGYFANNGERAAFRQMMAKRPEVFRRALAEASGDMPAIRQLSYETDVETVLGLETQDTGTRSSRARLASRISDPEVREKVLLGQYAEDDIEALIKAAEKERIRAEGEHARDIGKLEKQIEALEVKGKERLAKAKGQKKEALDKIREQTSAKVKAIREKYAGSKKAALAKVVERQKERNALRKVRELRKRLIGRIRRPMGKGNSGPIIWARQLVLDVQAQTRKKKDEFFSLSERSVKRIELDEALQENSDIRRFIGRKIGELNIDDIEFINDSLNYIRTYGRGVMVDRIRREAQKREALIRDFAARVYKGDTIPKGTSIEAQNQRKSSWWVKHALAVKSPNRLIRDLLGTEDSPFFRAFVQDLRSRESQSLSNIQKHLEDYQTWVQKNEVDTKELYNGELSSGGRTYTVQQVMTMYLSQSNSEADAAVVHGEFQGDRELRDRFVDMLDPRYKDLADFISAQYGTMTGRFGGAFERNKNIEFTQVEGKYFPMLRIGEMYTTESEAMADRIVKSGEFRRASMDTSRAKGRVKIRDEFQKPIKLELVDVFFREMPKMERYAALGDWVTRMDAVRKDPLFQGVVESRLGMEANRWFQDFINDVMDPTPYTGYDPTERFLTRVRKYNTLGVLAGNLKTMAIQGFSYFQAMGKVGLVDLAAAPWQYVMKNPMKINEFINRKDPLMKDRSINPAIAEARKAREKGVLGAAVNLSQEMMKPIGWIDKMTASMVWMAKYNEVMRTTGSDAQAVEAARQLVLESQPTSLVGELPALYRSKSELVKWLTRFTRQLNQIYNTVMFDAPYAVRQGELFTAMAMYLGTALNFAVMSYFSGFRLPEDPEDVPKEVAEEALTRIISMIPMYGSVLSAMLSGRYEAGVQPLPFAEEIVTALRMAASDDKDLDDIMKTLASVGMGVGISIGAPAVAIRRTVNAIRSAAEGKSPMPDLIPGLFIEEDKK